MARNTICKKFIDGSKVVFTFATEPPTVLSLDITDIESELFTRLALHGAAQKIGDSYAGVANAAEGVTEATAVIESLTAGVWGREREPGEGNLLERAVARLTSKPLVDITARLATLTKEQVKELRKRPEIITAMAAIKAEAVTVAGPSVESLFA